MRSVIILVAAVLLSSCTVTPKVAEPAKASPWAQTNIIGYDLTGYTVGPDWIRAYHGLLKAYVDKLPTTEQVPIDDMNGIVSNGANFHITFLVNRRMADLLFIERHITQP